MIRLRRWRWLGIAVGLLALAWLLYERLDAWRARGTLRLAQQEIALGQLEGARRRLSALAATPGVLGGAADYWLGICEALRGHPEAALGAFGRLPEGYAFDPIGAYHEAKANLSHGRLHAAERRLEQAVAAGGPGQDRARDLLSHVYQLEVRFDDLRGLFQTSLAAAGDPTRDLKELSNLDLERLPYQGLRAALELAGKNAPQDDRVWLGKARLAIEAGRWDEAEAWLRRCRDAGADAPVWRSWIEWARGSVQPEEALEAVRHLDPAQLDAGARLELLAWVYQTRGETEAEAAALERWLQLEPTARPALERLAELAHQAGRHDRAADLRRRMAELERAMADYRQRLWHQESPQTARARAEMAHLAEAAGRPHEAHALLAWAHQADPDDATAREGLARIERSGAIRQKLALFVVNEPWPEPPALPGTTRRPPLGRGGTGGSGPPPPGRLAFADDAEAAGLKFVYDNHETPIRQLPEPFGGGLALLDYDGDGWLDVYCVQGSTVIAPHGSASPDAGAGTPQTCTAEAGDRLFRNRGDGTFEDVTARSGIDRFPRDHGHGVTVGDIDGDGCPDLFLTRWRSYALYRNCGDGTFEDVTGAWGLGGRRDWPTSAALADFDGDGDLDLYVCHYAAWDRANPQICRDLQTGGYLNCTPLIAKALPDHLFRNDAKRFVDVTAEAGIVDSSGRGLGVAAVDLDDDGRIDLFVANDSSANFLFHNRGGMRFQEIAESAGVAGNASGNYQAGMGVAAGDLDGDGLIDLVVTNFYGESTTFFRNLGGAVFTDATATVGLGIATRRLLGFGVGLLDADNDGRLDLASAYGHVNDLRPNYPYRMPAQLLLGGADGCLRDVSDRAGAAWQVPRMGRGLAAGDIDNDGREDVLILSHNQPVAYLHNQTAAGRYLTFCLLGCDSNRDAVGAKVMVLAAGRSLVLQRAGGGSYQSSSDPRLHVGLGAADRVDSVVVAWPSGRVDCYFNLDADAAYMMREEDDGPRLAR
jgi:tetratricopeptide (TPR) repeat protein